MGCKPFQLGILKDSFPASLLAFPPFSSSWTLAVSLHERSPRQAFAREEAALFQLLPAQGRCQQNALLSGTSTALENLEGREILKMVVC